MSTVKKKVSVLLGLGKHKDPTEDAINEALRFAERLVSDHWLTSAELKVADPHTRAAEVERACGISHGGTKREVAWERRLSLAVAMICHVGVSRRNDSATDHGADGMILFDDDGHPRLIRTTRYLFYGMPENIQAASELFDEVRLTIAAVARLKFGKAYIGRGGRYSERLVMVLYDKADHYARYLKSDDCKALVTRSREVADEWLRDVEGIENHKPKSR